MLINLKRVIKFALNDFNRNKGISIATIFVLFITMMLITGLVFFHGLTNYLTSQLQNKIDITVYFKSEASEEKILEVKEEIVKMFPNIKKIEYVSKEQALAIFMERHGDNPVLSRALQEVGGNPLLPSLNIITTNGDPAQYEEVSNTLQGTNFYESISHIDFLKRKDTIEKVYSINKNINIFGLLLGAIMVVVAVLVVFNTVKLAIEKSKEEITTMMVVGASDWFIKGPFIIQGIIYGLIAFIICFVVSALAAFGISSRIDFILPGFNTFSYFLTNWWIFVLIQLGFGIAVGAVSSYIVVRKHLEN